MAYMRGLELVCIGKTKSFEIRYEDGHYVDRKGREVEPIDMACFACGASYYTLDEDEAIDFCPNCGKFEKMEHKTLSDLLAWSRTQDWSFLRFSGRKAFGVMGKAGWELRFAENLDALRRRGELGDMHEL